MSEYLDLNGLQYYHSKIANELNSRTELLTGYVEKSDLDSIKNSQIDELIQSDPMNSALLELLKDYIAESDIDSILNDLIDSIILKNN